MNIINEIIANIEINKINNLPEELRKIALVKMIYIESAKYFYRDELFFLFKEDLKLRNTIYNKEIDFNNLSTGNITCNSYCKILCYLFDFYNIENKKIDYDCKRYIHTKIIVDNKYIIDPLVDLINVKMHTKLSSFGEKEANYTEITEATNQLINQAINYDENKYERVLERIKEKLSISSMLDNLKYINDVGGIVDLKMILNKVIKDLSLNYKTTDYFVDVENIKDLWLISFLNSDLKRKRGIIIEKENVIYLVSLGFNYLKMLRSDWNNIVNNNLIKENKFISIKCIKYLKEHNLDEEIIHNRWVLKLLKNLEEKLAKTSEELINYITITNDSLLIEYNCSLCIYIENNELHLYDNIKNNDFVIDSLSNGTRVKRLVKSNVYEKRK